MEGKKTKAEQGLQKISRLITEVEIINFSISQGVTGPQWQKLTLAKNDIFARVVSIIEVIRKGEMDLYNTKFGATKK